MEVVVRPIIRTGLCSRPSGKLSYLRSVPCNCSCLRVHHSTDRWGKPSRSLIPLPRSSDAANPPRHSHLFYTHLAASRSIVWWNVRNRSGNGYTTVSRSGTSLPKVYRGGIRCSRAALFIAWMIRAVFRCRRNFEKRCRRHLY